jgi:hypothetical protein
MATPLPDTTFRGNTHRVVTPGFLFYGDGQSKRADGLTKNLFFQLSPPAIASGDGGKLLYPNPY